MRSGVGMAMAWVLMAGVLLTTLGGCRGNEKVRFVEPCPVYAEPTPAASRVGKIVAGVAYEVRRRDGKWIQVRVTSNSSIGWVDCPLQP